MANPAFQAVGASAASAAAPGSALSMSVHRGPTTSALTLRARYWAGQDRQVG